MAQDYKILVIDDEVMIIDMLKKNLEAEGYIVYTAFNSDTALDRIGISPDIILLDINMPGMDGLELCQLIREHVVCPIIFLTARVTEQDKINGLMAGGDDYITKPFSINELLARISAHLRRENRSHTAMQTRFSEKLVVDYSGHQVYYDNNLIDLSNIEYEIIELLSRNAGMVFDRETIYERIWGYEGEGDSIVVKEHIRKIRNKMAAFTDRQYIKTVWGVGYRWEN